MAVITISRLLGSGGDDIAAKAAEGLGYDLVDSSLLVNIAERAGVSVDEVKSFDETYHSRAGDWLKGFITPRISKIMLEKEGHLDPDSYIKYCKQAIQGLAEKGNMVIVGRGGQYILEEDENAFHVRIIADDVFRTEFVKVRQGISSEKAREVIKKSDRMRHNFIEQNFKRDLNDPNAYHLVIDSARLDVDVTAEVIVEAVRRFSYTHEYVPGEKDRRSSDRREGRRRKGERRDPTSVWTHRDMENAMIREGRPVRSLNKPDSRRGDRRIGGRRD